MNNSSDFCCEEIFEAFYDGVIKFDDDSPGDTKNLWIKGEYKEGDPNIPDSSGVDQFKIKYCPFCGTKLN